MIGILTVLFQIVAVFFLVVSGLLLILYNDSNKKSIKYWGKGLMLWGLASFLNIFGYLGTSDVNLAFYMLARLVLAFSFIIFLFQGTLTLLVPAKQARLLSVVYFFIVIVVDFTINMIDPRIFWENVATHNIYVAMPLTIVFFSYFYTYYLQLKDNIVLEMSGEWGILFILSMFSIIFASMGLIIFLRVALLSQYIVMIFISFSFDRFRKRGETWEKVTTPKMYVIDSDFLEFMNRELKKDTRPIIESMLAKHGVESLSQLKVSGQKELFIDNLLNNNFSELSPQRKAILKTKIIEVLGLNASHWRTAENP